MQETWVWSLDGEDPTEKGMATHSSSLAWKLSLEGSYEKPEKHIKKQRHHFTNKGLYSQSYVFVSSKVQMWELGHKKDWALKNWCFWIVVLEKTLERSLDCKEIKPVRDQARVFLLLLWQADS